MDKKKLVRKWNKLARGFNHGEDIRLRIQKPQRLHRLDFENHWMWILPICFLTLMSCIPFLIPIPLDESGAPLNEDAIPEILEKPHSKVTVKEIFTQVPILREEADLLVYRWPTTEWALLFGFIGYASALDDYPLPADNILIITFDHMGMVDRYTIMETGASKYSDEEIGQAIAELQATSTGMAANGE